MATLASWLPFILFLGMILAGTFWLAHEMGEQVGYEHGRNDEHTLSLLRECRMWEGDKQLIDFANTTTTEWSK